MSTIGKRIRQKRIEAELSQGELAMLAGWGDNQTRISSYESGRTKPCLEYIEILANVLGCHPSWLAFGELAVTNNNLPTDTVGVTIEKGLFGQYRLIINKDDQRFELELKPEELARAVTGQQARGRVIGKYKRFLE